MKTAIIKDEAYDDQSIPIEKRKVEFVKSLMRKGENKLVAMLICSRRFIKEENER